MVNSMPEDFPPQLIALARGLNDPSSELAWQYPTILEVVAALAARGDAILGGDVMYDVEGWGLDYCYDNWSLDWKGEGAWADYVAESVAVAARYIEAYVQRNGGDYWFVPVFTDEEGHAALRARKA
jgi:Immunity protein 40